MAVSAAVTAFTDAASAYSAAAQANAADPSLPGQLAALPALCSAGIAALRAASTAPEVADAVTACEVLLAQCAALGDAVRAEIPPIVTRLVGQPMPLGALASRYYGAKASQHFDEILQLNPVLLGEILIPPGPVRLSSADLLPGA